MSSLSGTAQPRRRVERLAFAALMFVCACLAAPALIQDWETARPVLGNIAAFVFFSAVAGVVVVGAIRAIEEANTYQAMPERGLVGVEVPQAPVSWRDCLPAAARKAWEQEHIQPSPAEVQAAKEQYARLWAGHEGEATQAGWKGKAIYVDEAGNVLEYEVEETRRRWEESQAHAGPDPDREALAERIRRAKEKIRKTRSLQAGGDDLEII